MFGYNTDTLLYILVRLISV